MQEAAPLRIYRVFALEFGPRSRNWVYGLYVEFMDKILHNLKPLSHCHSWGLGDLQFLALGDSGWCIDSMEKRYGYGFVVKFPFRYHMELQKSWLIQRTTGGKKLGGLQIHMLHDMVRGLGSCVQALAQGVGPSIYLIENLV